jgi:hypothetical protein
LELNKKNSDPDEDHGQQKEKNVDCDATFETSWSSSEPRLLTYENPKLARDLNLSKNKLLSGFLNKSLETSPSKY